MLSHTYSMTPCMHLASNNVTSPIHKCNHILDLIYCEVNSDLNLHNCKIHEFISDHALVTIDTTLNKAPWKPTQKIIRDTTRLTKKTLERKVLHHTSH